MSIDSYAAFKSIALECVSIGFIGANSTRLLNHIYIYIPNMIAVGIFRVLLHTFGLAVKEGTCTSIVFAIFWVCLAGNRYQRIASLPNRALIEVVSASYANKYKSNL